MEEIEFGSDHAESAEVDEAKPGVDVLAKATQSDPEVVGFAIDVLLQIGMLIWSL